MKLTAEQEALLSELGSDLQRHCALEFVKLGFKNNPAAYLSACEIVGKEPSKNPDVSGSEILNNPSVIKFLNSIRSRAAEEAQTDLLYVLKRLRQIDELDVIDIVKEDLSGFRALNEWPKEWRTSISGLDMKRMIQAGDDTPIEVIVEKIKWPDKVKNLELIGRHVNVKAWEKEVEVKNVTNNIMPVPCASSVDEWEKAAQQQQSEALSHD
jgi:phage terminase small subunit